MAGRENPLLRELLPNTLRARIRGAIETLPAPLQGLFPAPDVRRQIRDHPENRDDLDPEWRQRAGKPAPNEVVRTARRNFILLEKDLARAEYFQASEAEKNRHQFERAQIAGYFYDGMVETLPVSGMIYGKLFGDLPWNEDMDLLLAIMIRAQAAFVHQNLAPLSPFVLFEAGTPDYEHWLVTYGQSASRRRFIAIVEENVNLIPFDLSTTLFQYIGVLRDVPVVANNAEGPQNVAIQYEDLPDEGAIDVNAEDLDRLAFTTFEEDEPLIIIRVGAVQHVFKQDLLLQWLNQQLAVGQPLRNPATNEEIVLANLRRGRAHVIQAGTGGGRRRTRRCRRRARRTTRCHRRAGQRMLH